MRNVFPEEGAIVYGLFSLTNGKFYVDECEFCEKHKLLWGTCYFSSRTEAYEKLQELFDSGVIYA